MGKWRASVKWKIRVYDAVVVAKLMYGLTSVPLSKADANTIVAFHLGGLRNILKVKHQYWSRIKIRSCLKWQTTGQGTNRRKAA